jgi:hypothetical protein
VETRFGLFSTQNLEKLTIFLRFCKFRLKKGKFFGSVKFVCWKFVCCVSSSVVKKREKGSKNE